MPTTVGRYYDPATGQFLTRDPLTATTGAPYSYVGDNPLNDTDPTGMMCFSFKCVVHDVQVGSAVVQAGADAVAVVSAAVGAEPVAAIALGVSEAAGAVNVGATCLTGNVGNCAADAAITIGTAGLGEFLAPGQATARGAIYRAGDRVVQGGINLFGDLYAWANGYKTTPPPGPSGPPVIRPASLSSYAQGCGTSGATTFGSVFA